MKEVKQQMQKVRRSINLRTIPTDEEFLSGLAILLCEHPKRVGFGLVLNKPSILKLKENGRGA